MRKAERGIYEITHHAETAPGIFEMRAEAPGIGADATAGQFVNVYLPGGATLLPRPLGIADADGGSITLVYAVVGAGTSALSHFTKGERIEIMGPLGTGFFDYHYQGYQGDGTFDRHRHSGDGTFDVRERTQKEPSLSCFAGDESVSEVLLIGGGTGVPPLYFAARQLRDAYGKNIKLTAFLGFPAEPWYAGRLEGICDEVFTASETEGAAEFYGNAIELLRHRRDGSFYVRGRTQKEPSLLCSDRQGLSKDPSPVMGPAASPAMALACGPRAMLAAAAGWCEARDIPLRVSLEERMGCGYGACAGCTVNTRLLNDESKPQNGPKTPGKDGFVRKKVCVHGPAFWGDEVVW